MKNIFFASITLILCAFSSAHGQSQYQDSPAHKIGFHISTIGESDIIYSEDIVGASSFIGQSFYSIGINYISPLNNWLELETGIEYSDFKFKERPSPNPNIDYPSYTTHVQLLEIPVQLRASFLKYLYAHAGLLFDIDISGSNSIDDQTGFGGITGIGAKYDFDFGGSLFINPYIKTHSLLTFSQDGSYQQQIIESSIRVGVSYNF
ncbi:outer membrane beta-barrel protein [Gracilimonas mengyeensis]|nr:outer membrane beta-barrel protein [Gracilimonas mengyeensis]